MNLKIRIGKDHFQYILIYFMIISHGAQIYATHTITIRYGIIMTGILYCLINHKSTRHNRYITHIALFSLFMLMQTIVKYDMSYFQKYLTIVEHLIIVFVAVRVNPKRFATRFINAVVLISLVSIPFYIVQCLNPTLLTKILPETKGWSQRFYGNILFTYRSRYAEFRNNAIFTEPGIFQILLNSAIYLLLFLPHQCFFSRVTKRNILILLITMVVTTGSTTGFLALFSIILVYLLFKSKQMDYDNRKYRKQIINICIISLMLLFLDYFINQKSSILQVYMFDKFLEMGVNERSSGNARTITIIICLQQLIKNPLGFISGLTYYKVNQSLYLTNLGAAGCKIIPFITAVGIPGLVILHWPYYISPLLIRRRLIEKLLIIFLYWNTALAQSREMYPALLIPMVILSMEEKERETLYKNRVLNERYQ